MVFPFLWMLVTSFKDYYEIIDPTSSFFPKEPTLANYKRVFETAMFGRWFLNSIFVASLETTSVCVFGALVGYTLAKFHFPGRNLIFIMILSTLMIPTEMLVIPWYLMVSRIGLIDTYWGIWFPSVITGFGVFLMRQFMLDISEDHLNAARIEGCKEFGVFTRIVIPFCKPALVSLALYRFLAVWNDLFWPLLVVGGEKWRTLPVAIQKFDSQYFDATELKLATAFVAALPILMLLTVFSKQVFNAMSKSGGLKY